MTPDDAAAEATRLVAEFDDAQLMSAEGQARWHPVMLDVLRRVRDRLPPVVADLLARAPDSPPGLEDTGSEREALWTSIAEDRMGETPRGAATRAALYLFYPFDPADQDGAAWTFCRHYCRAGLPVDVLETVIREHRTKAR